MTLAFSSKSPFVPNPSKNHQCSRWIASLSDGTTIFEDVTPNIRSAWLRLRDHVETHKLKLTNLRLEAYGRSIVLIPYKSEDKIPQINGYFYSKRMTAILNSGPGIQFQDVGIGFIKGKEVFITWVRTDGSVFQEVREYKKDNQACIINDHPS